MTKSIANQESIEQQHLQEWQASQIPQPIIDRNFRTYLDPRDVDELLNFNANKKWKHSNLTLKLKKEIEINGKKTGRSFTHVELKWWRKSPDGEEAAIAEQMR